MHCSRGIVEVFKKRKLRYLYQEGVGTSCCSTFESVGGLLTAHTYFSSTLNTVDRNGLKCRWRAEGFVENLCLPRRLVPSI